MKVILLLVVIAVPILAMGDPGSRGEKTLIAPAPPGPYLVFVDADEEFLPAANAMAALHDAELEVFNPDDLEKALAVLRRIQPRFVVFVLPPEKIDVDLAHQILVLATQVDDDLFVDFEYGFVTGRNGDAALNFINHIEAGWKKKRERTVALFGAFEGAPSENEPLSALKAIGFSAREDYVLTRDSEKDRNRKAREALERLKQSDALLFFSHGEPEEMSFCFRGRDLRNWSVKFESATLFNCACYNGAPGRWFAPGPAGVDDRGVVPRDESVALAMLETGVSGYFAGIDAWHGPLAIQVFYHVCDEGMRQGEAAKRMYDRLALDFLPARIQFPPSLESAARFAGEGTANRRHNGAGMIFYGDPAFAPYLNASAATIRAKVGRLHDRLKISIDVGPQIEGNPCGDAILPINRLTDYYSVKTDDLQGELRLEVYGVVPVAAGIEDPIRLRITSAESGGKAIPTGPLQAVVETAPSGRLLHVRVPIRISLFDMPAVLALASKGIEIELQEDRE